MVVYSETMIKYEKNDQKQINKKKNWIFISIQGVQGAIPEGPEPIPELRNA